MGAVLYSMNDFLCFLILQRSNHDNCFGNIKGPLILLVPAGLEKLIILRYMDSASLKCARVIVRVSR